MFYLFKINCIAFSYHLYNVFFWVIFLLHLDFTKFKICENKHMNQSKILLFKKIFTFYCVYV